ncbi:hypothetical protein UABAM_02774 [Candidatus Uabimicrobium amorphum]|uniref:Uncharacterized protein n=1 Tax=Uabimicrobium amorphum TaxID=2596890 RepID=A0A5S9IMG5_UABAM|nr:hypothetical protein UABAM_02774 [Candidatus Uabimicrobium amorphum]
MFQTRIFVAYLMGLLVAGLLSIWLRFFDRSYHYFMLYPTVTLVFAYFIFVIAKSKIQALFLLFTSWYWALLITLSNLEYGYSLGGCTRVDDIFFTKMCFNLILFVAFAFAFPLLFCLRRTKVLKCYNLIFASTIVLTIDILAIGYLIYFQAKILPY